MKQLIQNLRNGKMEVMEVPVPALNPGYLLVKTHFSLISTGTESSKVINARKGYIGKAKAKPDQLKQVIESAKSNGLISTYHKVMNKLDAPSPLGYSCAGEVIQTGDGITGFKTGDMVACGGSAYHAEVNSVPKNLCAKLPSGVKPEHAAYTTLGAIAMQGVRQADLRIGECCAVIGLGLIGQLTVQILKAAGITVAGIDIDKNMVELAKKSGADYVAERQDASLESQILDISNGHGLDAVIITAGTSSLDPVELAGTVCRKKGKVVIVGAVPTGFSRENYYKKELSLLMSCSYGPGRYDSDYEIKGIDYPIGYARWTENRNMQAFLKLIGDNKLKLDLLTSHIFKLDKAIQAYELVVNNKESFIGILLQYNQNNKDLKKIFINNKPLRLTRSTINIGFIGAGSFAQKVLLPNASKFGNMIGVATASGHTARNIADKYNLQFATGDYKDICLNNNINTVFIATRHNLHAKQVLECLKNNKNIFVEKPLCLTEQELQEIVSAYNNGNGRLIVGFNRRFSPFVQNVIDSVGKETPKAINYRVNAGAIPSDSWIQDIETGGGRILGEVCHFVDLAMFIVGAPVKEVSAFVMDEPQNNFDTLITNLKFKNGSIATISYFSNGSNTLKKEYLEVFCNGTSAVINDFKELRIYGKKNSKRKLFKQDKGHAKEVELFLKSIREGSPEPIPFEETYNSTLATFKIVESIKTGSVQHIENEI